MSEQGVDADDTAEQPVAPARTGTQRDGIDPKLLEVLVCPQTRGPLRYDREAQELISERASLAYPIRDGVPVMLAGEARKLDG